MMSHTGTMEGGEVTFMCPVGEGEGLVKGTESSSSIVGRSKIMSKYKKLNKSIHGLFRKMGITGAPGGLSHFSVWSLDFG